jgi:hypothetical protein
MRLRYLIKIAAVLVGLAALGSLVLVFLWHQPASTILYSVFFAVLAISGFIGWCWMFHARAKSIIQKWAAEHGYVILQCDSPFHTGAFSFWTTSRGQIVYSVTVRDATGRERKAWVRCGSYTGSVLFSDKIEVRWQDEQKPPNTALEPTPTAP